MICEEDEGGASSVLLCDADFPCDYVNLRHPEDYELQDAPIAPSFIVNQRRGHARLILRISWRVGGKFMPMSFIVDTGAIHPIYLGTLGMRLMEAHGRLAVDELGNDIVKLHRGDGRECSVHYEATPRAFDPANIIGLRFLLRFGLVIDGATFAFKESFDHF